MGNLVKETPYSEITATLELLDRYGVGRDHLMQLRAASPDAQRYITLAIKKLDIFSGEKKWRQENDIIYFTVVSDGTTGENWVERLEGKHFRFGQNAKQACLRPSTFVPTSGLVTHVAVLKGTLFTDDRRYIQDICLEAEKRKLIVPNVELACLIREKFTDDEIEQMGLERILVMHKPVYDSDDMNPILLGASLANGGRWLFGSDGKTVNSKGRFDGFAFALSQVSLQS